MYFAGFLWCLHFIKYISYHLTMEFFCSSKLLYNTYSFKTSGQTSFIVTGLPQPCINVRTTSQHSHQVQNGSRSQFGVEWVVFFGWKREIFLFYQLNSIVQKVERHLIDIVHPPLPYHSKIPECSIYISQIDIHPLEWVTTSLPEPTKHWCCE